RAFLLPGQRTHLSDLLLAGSILGWRLTGTLSQHGHDPTDPAEHPGWYLSGCSLDGIDDLHWQWAQLYGQSHCRGQWDQNAEFLWLHALVNAFLAACFRGGDGAL